MHTEKNTIVDFKNISIFNGLNSLRFIAALFVLMHHSETIKRKNGLNNLEWLGLFRNGGNAVTFFFVLSGFLITYLLLKEQDNTGEIKIKTFYLKRILRIWPLYFLIVLIGFIIMGVIYPWMYHQVYFDFPPWKGLLFFLFFL